MQEVHVTPDAVTFSCVLSACSRANLVVRGQEIFKMMRDTYSIIPSAYHINCIVDLLARAGHVSEAEKLVNSSPDIPTFDTCRALLNACRKFVEVGVGERCFYGNWKSIFDRCGQMMKRQYIMIV
ncbi:hypothetical protein KP509_11G093900 [Ceratopteris richardii]|nr:hypothetical protein KP509_11G093900 [Ceratopteris richardii]